MKKIVTLLLVLAGIVSTASADDTWSLRGGFNGWSGDANQFAFSGTTGTVTATLTVGQTTSFKIVKNDGSSDTWYSLNDGGNVTYSNRTITLKSGDGSNAYLIAGEAGTYTFTLDISGTNPSLTVTYPAYTGKIYFCNTLSWATPYVYILTTDYWDNTSGAGSNGRPAGIAMTQIGTTNIWQASCPSGITEGGFYVAFLNGQQDGYNNFYGAQAVYRGDYLTGTPLFVPNTSSYETKNTTNYYNDGEWHTYPTYTRSVTEGKFGTICLPFNATVTGATVFTIASTVGSGDSMTGINLTSVESLEAGKAYIFKATGTTLTASYSGSYTAASAANGMMGNLSSTAANVAAGNYIVKDNKICKVVDGGSGVTVGQYKAYITLEGISPVAARGFDFVPFEDETTGITNVEGAVKNGETYYDLSGRRVAQPKKGLYIANGKKYIVK